MIIIGLGNKARHGKDSFAEAVQNYYDVQNAAFVKHGMRGVVTIQRHAFANALYKEVNDWLATDQGNTWAHDTSRFYAYIPEEKDGVADARFTIPSWVTPTPNAEVSARAPHGKHAKLLQWWGTEYRRTQDPNYWVKHWADGINKNADIVLVTDMRFENEAAAIKAVGGYTVRVSRANQNGTPFVDPSRDANHPSETQLDDYNYDYWITVKTGDLALLQEWAITLVHYLRARKGE